MIDRLPVIGVHFLAFKKCLWIGYFFNDLENCSHIPEYVSLSIVYLGIIGHMVYNGGIVEVFLFIYLFELYMEGLLRAVPVHVGSLRY